MAELTLETIKRLHDTAYTNNQPGHTSLTTSERVRRIEETLPGVCAQRDFGDGGERQPIDGSACLHRAKRDLDIVAYRQPARCTATDCRQ